MSVEFVNPFHAPGQWYKANLHCHSTCSDGEVPPAERVRQYRKKNYDILALTDHRTTTDTAALSSPDFLVLCGIELHPERPHIRVDTPHHLVCLNVPHGFFIPDDSDANDAVRQVRAAGGTVIYAHPYRYGHNINHLAAVEGYAAIEVYNASGLKVCKEFSTVHWDDLLLTGRRVGGVAVDDIHRGTDMFMGWTWIKAPSLTAAEITAAIETGCYYASTGPEIHTFELRDTAAVVECSPAAEIRLIGPCEHGKLCRAGSEPLTRAAMPLGPEHTYIRAEVRDAAGRTAWTNPIFRK